MQSGLQQLRHYPRPFWMALLPEGTRFTQAKLEASQEYASAAGLPIPRNVLIPRTKVVYLVSYGLSSYDMPVYELVERKRLYRHTLT